MHSLSAFVILLHSSRVSINNLYHAMLRCYLLLIYFIIFSLSYTVVYTFKFAMKMNALYVTSCLLECLKFSPKSNK